MAGLADLLTVEEAARVIRVGRTKAYAMAREWRDTGGKSGLPVIDLGHVLRVPRCQLEAVVGGPLTEGPGASTTEVVEPEAEAPAAPDADRPEPAPAPTAEPAPVPALSDDVVVPVPAASPASQRPSRRPARRSTRTTDQPTLPFLS